MRRGAAISVLALAFCACVLVAVPSASAVATPTSDLTSDAWLDMASRTNANVTGQEAMDWIYRQGPRDITNGYAAAPPQTGSVYTAKPGGIPQFLKDYSAWEDGLSRGAN